MKKYTYYNWKFFFQQPGEKVKVTSFNLRTHSIPPL